jgi:hypothetical protein
MALVKEGTKHFYGIGTGISVMGPGGRGERLCSISTPTKEVRTSD